WIDDALKIAPGEYWRYVLIAIRPEARDANFTWRDFESHVNSELNDVLGNFIHRTLTFINNSFDSTIPDAKNLNETDEKIVSLITNSPAKIAALLDNFELRNGLAAIIDSARTGNQYLSEREPWHLIKIDREKTATTLHLASQLVRSIGIMLAPFLPETSERIQNQLNLREKQNWWDAGKMTLKTGHIINKSEPLFHKILVNKSYVNQMPILKLDLHVHTTGSYDA